MRFLTTLIHLTSITAVSAVQLPDLPSFISSFGVSLEDFIQPNNASQPSSHDLLRRQFSNTCPTNFNNCANLGAPNLCCASAATCTPDQAGNVACCATTAKCTGTIGGVVTAGTVNSVGSVVGGGGTGVGAKSTTGSNGLVPANQQTTASSNAPGQYHPSTTTGGGGGFIVDGTSTVASPGSGVRGVEVPFIFQLIIGALGYLPM